MTPHINSTAGLTLGSLCHHMTIATFAIFKLTVYVEDFFFVVARRWQYTCRRLFFLSSHDDGNFCYFCVNSMHVGDAINLNV